MLNSSRRKHFSLFLMVMKVLNHTLYNTWVYGGLRQYGLQCALRGTAGTLQFDLGLFRCCTLN